MFFALLCVFAVGYSATWEASFVWSWAGMLLNFMVILSTLVNETPSKQACGSSSTQCFYKDDGALSVSRCRPASAFCWVTGTRAGLQSSLTPRKDLLQ